MNKEKRQKGKIKTMVDYKTETSDGIIHTYLMKRILPIS